MDTFVTITVDEETKTATRKVTGATSVYEAAFTLALVDEDKPIEISAQAYDAVNDQYSEPAYDYITIDANDPPFGVLVVSETLIEAGQPFTVRIYLSDPDGDTPFGTVTYNGVNYGPLYDGSSIGLTASFEAARVEFTFTDAYEPDPQVRSVHKDITVTITGSLEIETIWLLTTSGDTYPPDESGPIYSSPAFTVDGWVMIGGQTNLYKISPSSGYYIVYENTSPIWSSPSIDYRTNKLYVGTNDGKLVIYDADTDVYEFKVVSGYAIWTAPLIIGSNVFVLDAGGFLHCLDLDGNELWTTLVTWNEVWSSPIIGDSHIYVAETGGDIHAVSLYDGDTIWQYSTGDKFTGGFAKDSEGNIYIAGEYLWSFTSSGSLRFSAYLGSRTYANPVVSRTGRVFVGTIGGDLYAFNLNGNIIWQKHLGGSILCSGVIGNNGVLYIVSGTTLFALNPSDGSILDYLELDNFVESNPVFHGRRLYIADESGRLYIVKALSDTISDPSTSWPMFQRDWYHSGW
ncbi:MAG: hypothetical protein DRP27_03900 [Thermotogae bacterium]|nr:MAG: hypothetical protein DRP27_03900 [Thermotogota bacterium]